MRRRVRARLKLHEREQQRSPSRDERRAFPAVSGTECKTAADTDATKQGPSLHARSGVPKAGGGVVFPFQPTEKVTYALQFRR